MWWLGLHRVDCVRIWLEVHGLEPVVLAVLVSTASEPSLSDFGNETRQCGLKWLSSGKRHMAYYEA